MVGVAEADIPSGSYGVLQRNLHKYISRYTPSFAEKTPGIVHMLDYMTQNKIKISVIIRNGVTIEHLGFFNIRDIPFTNSLNV